MASLVQFNAGTKPIAVTTAQTVVFTSSDIPGTGVVKYIVRTTGANNSLSSAINRIRVKAGGQTWWDVLPIQMRRMMERLSRANQLPVAANLRFQIPLLFLDAKGDERYNAGFPAGQAPTIEVQTDATSTAGTARIGWEISTIQPQWALKFLSSQGNIGPSVTNGRIPITQDGLIRGVSLPVVSATGLLRAKLVLGGVEIFNLAQDELIEWQSTEDPGDNITTVPTHMFLKLATPLGAPIGNSYFEVDTGAAALVTDEYAIMSLIPQPK